jgi:Fe-S-cluster containining protein
VSCDECKGACCEYFVLKTRDVRLPDSDSRRWLELHAEVDDASTEMTFDCRCTKLTTDGRCGIYETRPLTCRLFVPGSQDCLDAVRRQRTPEQYERIRDADDPLVLRVRA